MCEWPFSLGEPFYSEWHRCGTWCMSDNEDLADFKLPKSKKPKKVVAEWKKTVPGPQRFAEPASPLNMVTICKGFVLHNITKLNKWIHHVFDIWRSHRNSLSDTETWIYWKLKSCCFELLAVLFCDRSLSGIWWALQGSTIVNLLSGQYCYSSQCNTDCQNFMNRKNSTFKTLPIHWQSNVWNYKLHHRYSQKACTYSHTRQRRPPLGIKGHGRGFTSGSAESSLLLHRQDILLAWWRLKSSEGWSYHSLYVHQTRIAIRSSRMARKHHWTRPKGEKKLVVSIAFLILVLVALFTFRTSIYRNFHLVLLKMMYMYFIYVQNGLRLQPCRHRRRKQGGKGGLSPPCHWGKGSWAPLVVA